MRTISNCQFGTVAGVGGVLVLIGSVLFGFWGHLFDFVVRQQLVLSPNSYSFELWEEVPVPMYIEFYFFNWTNPEKIYEPNPEHKKPNLVQMGPYVFKEFRKKIVLHWNDNNETVTFLQNKTWYFEPSMSSGSLDDLVTTLNIPATTAVFAIRNSSRILKGLLNGAMMVLNTKLHVTKKVREFIFEGYQDPLMDLSTLLPEGVIPITIPFDKFGWFYTRNGSATYDGVFNMFTGKGNIDNFGKMGEWNYENPTKIYESFCGSVNGSAGEFFKPKPTKDSISLFSTDICRTLVLSYKEDVKIEGINAYRYWCDEHAFDNLTANPDNWCFCPSGECPPHGSIDVSTCKWGAPAFISLPHFFNADPSYSQAVDGMKPDESVHSMFIDLEQRTGIPIQVEAALQINILLRPHPEYSIFRAAPKIYFPVLWFKERARLDGDIKSQIQLVSRMPIAGYILFGALLCMGISTLLIAFIYFSKDRKERKSEDDLKLVGTKES